MTSASPPSQLLPLDVLRVGSIGLRSRRLRAGLSALGIAIGIASMVSVLGISESSKADLITALDRLGTNVLQVAPGQSIFGTPTALPTTAPQMIRRVSNVEQEAAVATVAEPVFRNEFVPRAETNGIGTMATATSLPDTLAGRLASGRFFDRTTSRYPTTVLGATAAERLGIDRVSDGLQVLVGGHRFDVVGILEPLELAPELDTVALIGFPVAARLFHQNGSASHVYVRTTPEALDDVRGLVPRTANPAHPEEVQVSRPSDALAARLAAKSTFTSLFLGLGLVALLVGGIGIANVMVISVIERRSEIGLRRALGAKKRHIALQFLTEAFLLAALGGVLGIALGVAVTTAYAKSRGWAVAMPASVILGSIGAVFTIGIAAGLYPATRAAKVAPSEALRTP